jgi:hypothetical protein
MMPTDRQYTKLEAACSITADIQDGTVRSANAYAKQFGWDHKRVQRFMTSTDLINLASPTDAQEQFSDYSILGSATPKDSPKTLAKLSAQQTPKSSPINAQEQLNDYNMLEVVEPKDSPSHAQQTPNVFNKEREKEKTCVLFDQFFTVYPKHKNKPAAERAFKKLNPSALLFKQMMDALAWQTKQPDWLKNNGQFIPLPSSWLNGRRWEDERLDTQTATTSQPQNTKPRLQVSL